MLARPNDTEEYRRCNRCVEVAFWMPDAQHPGKPATPTPKS